MPDASAIRMGGAYVEISADDTPMLRRLRESQARLRPWGAENSGPALTRGTEASVLAQSREGGGFLSGGFKGMQIAETGLKFATAIAAVKVGIKDVHMFSALFRGDMEGARKAAEELPFGLGEIVKELSGPVDSAMDSPLPCSAVGKTAHRATTRLLPQVHFISRGGLRRDSRYT